MARAKHSGATTLSISGTGRLSAAAAATLAARSGRARSAAALLDQPQWWKRLTAPIEPAKAEAVKAAEPAHDFCGDHGSLWRRPNRRPITSAIPSPAQRAMSAPPAVALRKPRTVAAQKTAPYRSGPRSSSRRSPVRLISFTSASCWMRPAPTSANLAVMHAGTAAAHTALEGCLPNHGQVRMKTGPAAMCSSFRVKVVG
mmetsp:Transcript_50256/g.161769  ORF Transcript_50256/g.161769 Transcript_50256/m.161769 type:complete len:200 (-) Transcript_50256:200-799(-)